MSGPLRVFVVLSSVVVLLLVVVGVLHLMLLAAVA